jgi:hypothetical protein
MRDDDSKMPQGEAGAPETEVEITRKHQNRSNSGEIFAG